MAPVLGYWNIRGLAQPIRLMLAYSETPFVDKQYAYGPAPDYDRSAWLKEKNMLGLDFPNLPYYIEDNVKMTQSVTIMRYLARKHKLDPETEEDRIRADMIEQQIVDIRSAFAKLCYNPEFEKLKDDYVKGLSGVLEPLSKFLGKGNWFASQDKVLCEKEGNEEKCLTFHESNEIYNIMQAKMIQKKECDIPSFNKDEFLIPY